MLPEDGSNVTTRLLKERAVQATVAAGGKMPKKRGRPGPKAALPAEEAAVSHVIPILNVFAHHCPKAARLRVAVAKERTAGIQEDHE